MSYIKLLLLYRKHIACLLLCVAVWMNASVFSVIYHQLRYDPAQLQNIKIKDHYKVAVYWDMGIGDLMLAKSILKGVKDIGWRGIFIEYRDAKKQLQQIKEFDPDFIIVTGIHIFDHLDQEIYLKQTTAPIYPVTFPNGIHGFNHAYPGYIVEVAKPYDILKEDKLLLLNMLSRWDSKPFAYVPFHDGLPRTKFQLNNYRNLVVVGTRWDKLRGSDKYTSFLAILGSKGYLNIYGPPESWQDQFLKPYWRGNVEYEIDLLQKVYQENGIALVMHGQRLLDNGWSTMRIIEPIAAGAVVICDNHRTVKEYFGDSVLYFDQTKSAAEIAATIDGHVSWIRSHPREASEMARRAHAIFLQHFTIEKELVKIAQMHEYILSNMKK